MQKTCKGKNKSRQKKQRKPSHHPADTLILLGSSKSVFTIQEVLHFSWGKKSFFHISQKHNKILKNKMSLLNSTLATICESCNIQKLQTGFYLCATSQTKNYKNRSSHVLESTFLNPFFPKCFWNTSAESFFFLICF